MRHLKIFAFVISLGLVFFSCDPCNNLDCASDNYFGQFRLVNASNGNDLVFGSSRIYDKNQIRFYSLQGSDTTFFDYQTIMFPANGYDSILYVRFFPKADTAYLQLSNGDIDTLNIKYNTFNTKCCGTITEIVSFRFNHSADIAGNDGTKALGK